MSEDDIDLDRVLIDPDYRRKVIDYLNAAARGEPAQPAGSAAVTGRQPAAMARN